jgi:hypothetical protein
MKKQSNLMFILFLFLTSSGFAQISTADLIVNPLRVTVGIGKLTLKTTVWNLSNDTAREARIVVLVSQEVNIISATKTVDGVTTTLVAGTDYDLHGSNFVIKIPIIDRGEARGVALKIVTQKPTGNRVKEFGVMAYNRLADGKPEDNYKSWRHL